MQTKKCLFNKGLSVLIVLISLFVVNFDIKVNAEDDMKEVASFEFEDTGFDGWILMGACRFDLETDIKYSGNSCLKISDRKAYWCGGSYASNTLLKPGHTYHFSSYVYQNCGHNEKIYATVRITNSNGVTDYLHINDTEDDEQSLVPSEEWFEISGTVKIPEDTVSSLIYIEAPTTSLNIYTDHFIVSEIIDSSQTDDSEITETSEISEKENKYNEKFRMEFESSEINTIPRGENIRLVKTDEISYNGKHSLYVSQREETWNGPSISTQFLENGTEYLYSVYVYYNDPRGNDTQSFLTNVSYYMNGKQTFIEMATQEVPKGQWTKIEGKCRIPANASATDFSVQTINVSNPVPSDLIDFYIDDILIIKPQIYQKENNIKISIIILCSFAAGILVIILITFIIKKRIKYLNYLKLKDIDDMTKVFNRNTYEKKIEFYEKNNKETEKLFVLTCDLDGLKSINDNFGHEKGDEAIRRCAETLRETIGWEGEVYRVGGDEFVCFTRMSLIEICRSALAKEGTKESDYRFSASLGQCSYEDLKTDEFVPDIKDIIKKADEMMYKEKEEKKKQ